MLQLILFAMIGVTIGAEEPYWIAYGVSVIFWFISIVLKVIKWVADRIDE